MYVGAEIKSLDEIFDNQYILSQNEFTSEEVNAFIDSMRWDINIFLKSKLCKRCKDKISFSDPTILKGEKMTKCDFCKEEKETKTIHSTDEKPIRSNICKECATVECPYLDWNKLSDWSKQKYIG